MLAVAFVERYAGKRAPDLHQCRLKEVASVYQKSLGSLGEDHKIGRLVEPVTLPEPIAEPADPLPGGLLPSRIPIRFCDGLLDLPANPLPVWMTKPLFLFQMKRYVRERHKPAR